MVNPIVMVALSTGKVTIRGIRGEKFRMGEEEARDSTGFRVRGMFAFLFLAKITAFWAAITAEIGSAGRITVKKGLIVVEQAPKSRFKPFFPKIGL